MTVWHEQLLGRLVVSGLDVTRIQAAEPFDPGANGEAADILGLLAWCMTAAAVGGLIITGMQMAIQLNRGTAAENSEYFRAVAMIFFACLIGASAGPLVTWFGDLGL
ncbi:hypothetical protein ABT336_17370 [Micromonospora sp. NPDC000207]|uniref:hypothetical protein n=1 Tax=Micromonospora sp. NPDC000207 TaxID=3154246 RepID=UPI003318D535